MKLLKGIWGATVALAWWIALMLCIGVIIGVSATAIAVPAKFIWGIFQ